MFEEDTSSHLCRRLQDNQEQNLIHNTYPAAESPSRPLFEWKSTVTSISTLSSSKWYVRDDDGKNVGQKPSEAPAGRDAF